MVGAGELRHRVGFYTRTVADDGYGNVQGGYAATPEFETQAAIKPKLGGEGVFAARLAGTNPVNITVRRSRHTEQVTTAWRLKDMRDGTEYNIRSIIDPDDKRMFFEMLCEKGVA